MYKALGDISLDLLRTFEAAARHRSFTAAALELGTTKVHDVIIVGGSRIAFYLTLLF